MAGDDEIHTLRVFPSSVDSSIYQGQNRRLHQFLLGAYRFDLHTEPTPIQERRCVPVQATYRNIDTIETATFALLYPWLRRI